VEVERDGNVVRFPGGNKERALEAEQPPAMKEGEPLSPFALVQSPAPIKGRWSWTVETRGHRSGIVVLAFSPDGRRLASESWEGIRIWNVQTGKLEQVLHSSCGESRRGWLAQWSKDGKRLVAFTGPASRPLQLWDTESWRVLRSFTLPSSGNWSPCTLS